MALLGWSVFSWDILILISKLPCIGVFWVASTCHKIHTVINRTIRIAAPKRLLWTHFIKMLELRFDVWHGSCLIILILRCMLIQITLTRNTLDLHLSRDDGLLDHAMSVLVLVDLVLNETGFRSIWPIRKILELLKLVWIGRGLPSNLISAFIHHLIIHNSKLLIFKKILLINNL